MIGKKQSVETEDLNVMPNISHSQFPKLKKKFNNSVC